MSKDYLRSLVVTLIAAGVVLPLGCTCVFIPLWLVTQLDASIWWLVASLALFVLITTGGPILAGAWMIYRRARRLDDAFNPLGLQGSTYLISGRQYHGSVHGRQVDVRFYRGPTIELYVGTSVKTRFSVAESAVVSTSLARAFGRDPLPPLGPDMDDLTVFAIDEAWVRSLLADPQARQVLRRLTGAGETWALFRQVHLQPGAFVLRVYRNKNLFRYAISPEDAQQWIDDLLTLARIAERLHAPAIEAEATSLENLARSYRGTILGAALPIVAIGGMLLCGVATGATVLFLVL
jgi:hypothetical protein